MPQIDTLRLIAGGTQSGRLGILGTAPHPLPQLTRRPGEHLELYEFGPSTALAPIRREARRQYVDAEMALAITIERALAANEIRARAGAAMLARLDQRSTESEVQIGLCSAHSSYLQHLLGRHPAVASERPLHSPRVALPMRLVDRLGGGDIDLDDEPEHQLAAAVRWEIAALVAGETISEWAYRTLALELLG